MQVNTKMINFHLSSESAPMEEGLSLTKVYFFAGHFALSVAGDLDNTYSHTHFSGQLLPTTQIQSHSTATQTIYMELSPSQILIGFKW